MKHISIQNADATKMEYQSLNQNGNPVLRNSGEIVKIRLLL
jgi:hypothetical protein